MPRKPLKSAPRKPTDDTIADRLKEYGRIKHNGIAGLERSLNRSVGFFAPYLRKENPATPGGELLRQIGSLGCDLHWLLGVTPPSDGLYAPEPTDTVSKHKHGAVTEGVIDVSRFEVKDENLVLLYPMSGDKVIVVRKSHDTTPKKKK